ncbi:ATP-binding protein [Actinoplanes sp. NPDC049599]|uniref:ATP-binding protein n=1 Tax=Actinoplanes sp. NPDC049599 TaxID=3363903 RepID=UPI0037A6E8E5
MSLLRTALPPAQAVELERWLLSSGTDLRPMRVGLSAALTAYGLVGPAEPAETGDRVILVATELASNALRHGSPPAVVVLLRGAGEFLLDVADHDPAGTPQLAHVGHDGVGGRGLHIARTLSREMCWYRTDRTKHIWASFPTRADGAGG